MVREAAASITVFLMVLAGTTPGGAMEKRTGHGETEMSQELPPPRFQGATSVEKALSERRSLREYRMGPLALAEASQLLWAAQGVTSPEGLRTAPSAGALYPLRVYLVAAEVEGLPAGVYHYHPQQHRLTRSIAGDQRRRLCDAALGQSAIRKAPALLVITATYERTTVKYGQRGIRYAHLDAGHAAENVYLQAAALDLGTVAIGAFDDAEVQRVLALPKGTEPLYIMPIGRRQHR